MKTPREILLRRHQTVEPKLDRIRAEVMTTELGRDARNAAVAAVYDRRNAVNTERKKAATVIDRRYRRIESNLLFGFALKLWRELVWPCRLTWAGLACAWLVIWGINSRFSNMPTIAASTLPVPAPAIWQTFEEQRRMLAEVTQPFDAQPVEPPHRNLPGPQSELQTKWRISIIGDGAATIKIFCA